MKRFLSWLTLFGCYIIFCLLVELDIFLMSYVMGLYDQLSAFLKLIVIIVGGSFIFGLSIAPLWYGIPLTYMLSEAVCPSKKGDRYIAFGALIVVGGVVNIITNFRLEDIFIVIFGIALLFYGRSHSN